MTVSGVPIATPVPYAFLSLISPPVIKTFTPTHGPVAGGTQLFVEGINFNSDANVSLAELDNDLQDTGRTVPCNWLGVGGSCNDTTVVYVNARFVCAAGTSGCGVRVVTRLYPGMRCCVL